jgi:hypothetical protein
MDEAALAELRQANQLYAADYERRLAAETVAKLPHARFPSPQPSDAVADRNRCQARALFAQLLDHDLDEARDVFRLLLQFAEEAGLLTSGR